MNASLIHRNHDEINLRQLISKPLPLDQFFPLALQMATCIARSCPDPTQTLLINPTRFRLKMTLPQSVQFSAESLPRTASAQLQLMEDDLPYIAPEQTGRIESKPDRRSVLYSLGVIFYEMLTGKAPFACQTPLEWMHAHIARVPPPLIEERPEVPQVLSDLVKKLLAKNPDDRYQSAESLRSDLAFCCQKWATERTIQPFSLAKEDHRALWHEPPKLYGNESELAALRQAFDSIRADQSSPAYFFISGKAGSGKTSLVQAALREFSAPQGLSVSGKFDQFQQEVPYSGLLKPLGSLLVKLLSLPEEELNEEGETLARALGSQAQALLELLPLLGPILREAPPAPELPPLQATSRHLQLMNRFVEFFAQRWGPLTLFLDDLHWADASSLKFLSFLASSGTKSILLIGTWRQDENHADLRLAPTINAIESSDARLTRISLGTFTVNDVTSLVADALPGPKPEPEELAALLHARTGGNPYFCTQFFKAIIAEGLVAYKHQGDTWGWDLTAIAAKPITADLADFLASQIKALSLPAQDWLSLAAVWGPLIVPGTLAQFLAVPPEELDPALHEPLARGLICQKDDDYYFAHDRIQEAAYKLIPLAQREQLHLLIARYMHKSHMNIYSLAEHYHAAGDRLDPNESMQVARLNWLAGRKSMASAAFESAAKFFAWGRGRLSPAAWADERELAFSLSLDEASCELAWGHLVAARERLDELEAKELSHLERIRLCQLWVRLFVESGSMHEALKYGQIGLASQGIVLPLHPSRSEVEQEYQKFWTSMGQRRIEDLLDLPLMSKAEPKEVCALLAALIPVTFSFDFHLVALTWCYVVNIIVSSGHCETSVEAFGCFGLIEQSLFERYEEGYRFGKMTARLVDKYGFEGQRLHSVGTLKILAFWTRPLPEARRFCDDFISQVDEVGANFKGLVSRYDKLHFMLSAGEPLHQLESETERVLGQAHKFCFHDLTVVIAAMRCLARGLRGQARGLSRCDDGTFFDEELEAHLQNSQVPSTVCFYYNLKLIGCYFAGNIAEARAAGEAVAARIWSIRSLPKLHEHSFYFALTLLALWEEASLEERGSLEAQLTPYMTNLAKWALINPHTFAGKDALVRAEWQRLHGNDQDALVLYDRAARCSREQGFVQDEALSYELMAQFYQKRTCSEIALLFLRQARDAYARWGAFAKVTQLEESCPSLDVQNNPSPLGPRPVVPNHELDFESLLSASRHISSEIDLSRLLHALLQLILTQAGADRVALLLLQGKELVLAAHARLEAEAKNIAFDIPASPCPLELSPENLPLALLLYVLRSGDKVRMESPSQRSLFQREEIFKGAVPESALGFPLKLHGTLIGIIYLENRTMAGAFTDTRIHVLEVLAAQASISIQHARLHQKLHEQASRLEAILSSIGDAVEVVDHDGRLLLANDAYRDLLKTDDPAPQSLAEMLEILSIMTWQGDNLSLKDLPQSKALEGEAVSQFGLRIQHPLTDKAIFLQSSATPVKDKEGRSWGAVTVLRDMSEWVELDQLKDQFLRAAAHELKTPVMIIKGYTQLLERQLSAAPGKSPELIAAIVEGVERLERLTSSLLDMSLVQLKKLRVRLEPLDLRTLVHQSLIEISTISKRHSLRELEMSPTVILGNPVRLRQVMHNLLHNAIKYSPEGGPIEVSLNVKDEQAVVTVRDYGIGIQDAQQKHIFSMFFQAHLNTSHDYGGMGIGLYLIREIIHLHGGKIWFSSEEGEGSSFSFSIPLTKS